MRPLRKVILLAMTCLLGPACGGSKVPPKPPPTLPLAPTNLALTPVSTARIDLAWTDNSSNEAEFRVWRSTSLGGPFVQVASVPPNTTIYSDRGLLAGTTYFYQVTAWNIAGDSAPTAAISAPTNSLAWTKGTMTAAGPSAGLSSHSAIFDSFNRQMVVFGGIDDGFGVSNQPYLLDLKQTDFALAAWSKPSAAGAPFLFSHTAVYDNANLRMVVFGGQDDGFFLQNGVYVLNLDPSAAGYLTWSQPVISGTPPKKRAFHTAIYDGARQRMIVFGGNDGTFELQDAYTLSLPATGPMVWAPVPVAGPLKRSQHASIQDPLNSRMVIFGGLDQDSTTDGSPFNSDSWTLSTAGTPSWTPLFFPSTPGFRRGHGAVYDAANQRMVVFGGATLAATVFNDLWAMRLDVTPVWSNPVAAGTLPGARKYHSAVYDSVLQRLVIYGGVDKDDLAINDVWALGL